MEEYARILRESPDYRVLRRLPEAHREMILDTLQSNPELRSKRNPFESFIDTKMANLHRLGRMKTSRGS